MSLSAVVIFPKQSALDEDASRVIPSPYLFLFGAEILALLLLLNQDIVGIKLFSYEFKLTQFADDTTLILDGTQRSLQADLNTLEIYGNFSGLKMNKEKTKVIWIGRKKNSKDKLKVSVNLDWGKSEFILLGITFNVDLVNMPENNLNNALDKVEIQLRKWKQRKQTPIGKITVLKTLILSKFIHIFFIITCSRKLYSQVEHYFFQFLWNNKPDKIKRDTICSHYFKGGLKMVNVFEFIKSLKNSWVRRIFFQADCQWLTLLKKNMVILTNIALKANGGQS